MYVCLSDCLSDCLSVCVCVYVCACTHVYEHGDIHAHAHSGRPDPIAVGSSVQDPDPNDLTVHQYLDLLDTLEILHWVWRYLN